MGLAYKLLLIALAIATGAHTDALIRYSPTLSPDEDTFITTQESPFMTDTSTNTVIDSAVSDNIDTTEPSVNTAQETSFMSDSNSTSTSNSSDQDATNPPTNDSTTISPGSISDRNTSDLAAQTDSTMPPAAVISKSSVDGLDLISYSNTQATADGSTGIVEALPIVFGALACVGAVVMAVTYKIKRGANEKNTNRLSPECEYSGDYLDDRALSFVQHKPSLVATKTSDIGTNALTASACIVTFVGPNSSGSSTSSFGNNRFKGRASSTVPSTNSNSESTMELQDAGSRHEEGIDVVLTRNEDWNSSRQATEVHL